ASVLHLDPRVKLTPMEEAPVRLALFDPRTGLQDLVERGLSARPELRESRALVAAASETSKGTRYGPLIPSLNAQLFGGGLGGGPDGGPTHFGAEGDYLVGLSWRIGPGGLFDPGRVRAHQARVAQAELSEAKLRDDISSQVVTALERVQSLADQIELSQAKLAAATETLRVT